MASREEILADFQACTGIDDVEIAICQLDAADWVLVDAVNKAMPTSPNNANSTATTTATTSSAATTTNAGASQSNNGASGPSSPSVQPPVSAPIAPPPPAEMMDMSDAGAAFSGNPFAGLQQQSGPSAAGISVADDFYMGAAGPSTSGYGPRFRMLDFVIQHGERTFQLKVPDNEDVKTLKRLIQSETGCPPCEQGLTGFKGSSGLPVTDRRRLSDLMLPRENVLYLLTPEQEDGAGTNGDKESNEGDETPDNFKLIITHEEADRTYTLNFRPTQTVLEIKLDLATLTLIPVSKQSWTGWPEEASDELSLAQIGIPSEHRLSVTRAPSSSSAVDMPILEPSAAGASTSNHSQQQSQGSSSHGHRVLAADSDDDFEDAISDAGGASTSAMDDDDFFHGPGGASSASSSRLQPLIPDDYGDEAMAGIKFGEEFGNRYGQPHPAFFPGALDDAIRESCQQPAKDRKMLAIYLHHDSSVLSNVFCTQALCADSVVAFMNENFVSFGWDVTHRSNRERGVKMLTQHFGSVAAATVRNLDIDRFPMLALVYKLRGTLEIFQIIHGNVTLDELMSQLLSAHDTYTAQLSVEIREEEERQARDAVKREQDLAFELAQQADREKDEQRRLEEEERKRQEAEEAAARASAEAERERVEAEKARKRREVARRLPAEPKGDRPHAKIRFRAGTAGGGGKKQLERRFLPHDRLQIVMDYLESEGFSPEEHKVLSSWPRRDLTTVDMNKTLEELKLYPQETLTLEEK